MNKRLNLILYSYLIFPIAIIFLAINYWLGWNVNDELPAVPEYWPFFNFAFNTPHVVASSLLILGESSWREYRFKFLSALTLFSVVTFLFFYQMHWKYFLVIYSVLTLKHVILQQFNLSHMFGVKKDWYSFFWKMLGLLAALVIYWKVYKTNGWELKNITEILIVLVFFFSALSSLMYFKYKDKDARRIILANTGMVILSYLAFIMGGEFFSVLCIRAVHDVTGFVHYVDVFKARREKGEAAPWYKALYTISKSDWFSTLFAPIFVVALILTLIPNGSGRMSLLMVLSLLHYYTESFTWKSEGVYRRELNLFR